jgi:hypothetical protein
MALCSTPCWIPWHRRDCCRSCAHDDGGRDLHYATGATTTPGKNSRAHVSSCLRARRYGCGIGHAHAKSWCCGCGCDYADRGHVRGRHCAWIGRPFRHRYAGHARFSRHGQSSDHVHASDLCRAKRSGCACVHHRAHEGHLDLQTSDRRHLRGLRTAASVHQTKAGEGRSSLGVLAEGQSSLGQERIPVEAFHRVHGRDLHHVLPSWGHVHQDPGTDHRTTGQGGHQTMDQVVLAEAHQTTGQAGH